MKVHIGKYQDNKKIDVKISGYDLWNLDHTLALIIHPALVKFRENHGGSPPIADKDVPKKIRSTSDKTTKKAWESDEFVHDRFLYVLDEMIWSFGEIVNDRPNEPNFSKSKKSRLKYEKRMNNGLRLFGKYYQGLWN